MPGVAAPSGFGTRTHLGIASDGAILLAVLKNLASAIRLLGQLHETQAFANALFFIVMSHLPNRLFP
jgi:hypothetical protein